MKLKEKIAFRQVRLTEATKRTSKTPSKAVGEFSLDYMGDKMELATILPVKFFTEEANPPAGVKVETIEFVSKSVGQYGIGWDFTFSAEVEITDKQIECVLSLDKEVRKEWVIKRRERESLRRKMRALEGEAATLRMKINADFLH